MHRHPQNKVEKFFMKNFFIYIYALMTRNLNPFSLDRKLSNQNKHEMIYMAWKECMPGEFYKYICLKENFLYLNRKSVLYPKVSDIIQKLIELDEKNYVLLRSNLFQYKNFFHYIYSNVHPEIYYWTERKGFDLKSTFYIAFKTYKEKNRTNG